MFSWLKKSSRKPKTLGQIGEQFAQQLYKRRGYKIIAANFFNKKGLRLGEVDFIAVDNSAIIFVEVKTRTQTNGKFGAAEEAVNQFKQIKLLKAVKLFLLRNRKYQYLRPQIDVCALRHSELDKPPFSATIIPNAVEDWN